MKLLTGIGGSKGYAMGRAVVKIGDGTAPRKRTIEDVSAEIHRFRTAQDIYDKHLRSLGLEAEKAAGPEAAEIFNAYRLIVRDDVFFKKALQHVEDKKVNVEYAVYRECKKMVALFESIKDIYMKERAVDIENVCWELIRILTGAQGDLARLGEQQGGILVADDLTPAETLLVGKKSLRGIVTERGGITSHTVILAKAMEIPAIIGVKGILKAIRDGDNLLLDGYAGTVAVNPDPEVHSAFAIQMEQVSQTRRMRQTLAQLPAATLDGHSVRVCVNSGDYGSLRAFDATLCDGIGLFRTEFIYMSATTRPTEDSQFEIYREIASRAQNKPVIIRTVDVGGENQIPYMRLRAEKNPALGLRGIRLCLNRQEMFASQLRAILRASAYGDIRVMFPMVVNLEELIEAKRCLEGEKNRLKEQNIAFRESLPVGVMIETPAAALLSDKLAAEVDFFSIGSNDLIQYTTAADRTNDQVGALYDNCNISVLRSIGMVAESAASAGIPWGICGEVASDERLVPLWVAMGVHELSVAPSQVGAVKHLIGRIDKAEISGELRAVLDCAYIKDVRERLDNILANLTKNTEER